MGRRMDAMNREHIVFVDQELCIKCGSCEKDCVFRVMILTESGAEASSPECAKCGHCVAVCPVNAVSMSGYEDVPEEIDQEKKLDPDILLAKIKARRSMRYFTDQEVSDEDIEKIIDAGRFTPTARNLQGTSYIVLKDNINEYEQIAVTALRRLKKVIKPFLGRYKDIEVEDSFFFKGAPVAIVIKSNDVIDGALAASLMELMAQSLGLGVLYSGFFTEAVKIPGKLKRKLQIPRRDKIVTTLVIGHPAVTYKRTVQRESARVQYV